MRSLYHISKLAYYHRHKKADAPSILLGQQSKAPYYYAMCVDDIITTKGNNGMCQQNCVLWHWFPWWKWYQKQQSGQWCNNSNTSVWMQQSID